MVFEQRLERLRVLGGGLGFLTWGFERLRTWEEQMISDLRVCGGLWFLASALGVWEVGNVLGCLHSEGEDLRRILKSRLT